MWPPDIEHAAQGGSPGDRLFSKEVIGMLDDDAFAVEWNRSYDLAEVATVAGMTPKQTMDRGYRLRKKGRYLKNVAAAKIYLPTPAEIESARDQLKRDHLDSKARAAAG